jgi:Bacterial type II/III secretion system short domain
LCASGFKSTIGTANSANANALEAHGSGGGGAGSGGPVLEGVRITADASSNSLLIFASNENYQLILRTLAQLDRPQLQVAIDATDLQQPADGLGFYCPPPAQLAGCAQLRWDCADDGVPSAAQDVLTPQQAPPRLPQTCCFADPGALALVSARVRPAGQPGRDTRWGCSISRFFPVFRTITVTVPTFSAGFGFAEIRDDTLVDAVRIEAWTFNAKGNTRLFARRALQCVARSIVRRDAAMAGLAKVAWAIGFARGAAAVRAMPDQQRVEFIGAAQKPKDNPRPR